MAKKEEILQESKYKDRYVRVDRVQERELIGWENHPNGTKQGDLILMRKKID